MVLWLWEVPNIMPRKPSETVAPKTRAKAVRATETTTPAPRRHKKATPVTASSQERNVSDEEIATLAFSYWEGRGYQGGSPEEDWFRAESALRTPISA